ncbi:MAG TPA: hypothetical protein VHK90_16905 [Thermoanaerobaculia bacterium]|nr:hypothetical protein [Thermoanaerobaculia bacterium]
MRLRFCSVFLALLAIATPLFARVISYAPYTNRTAISGIHERTTRHFVLLEQKGEFGDYEVVLYDSAGHEEPRVVFPTAAVGSVSIATVAMFERSYGTLPIPDLLQLAVFVSAPRPMVFFSGDGGATWKEVAALRDKPIYIPMSNVDFGGPWVNGMSSVLRIGSESMPFIFPITNQGIWAIDGNGNGKNVLSQPANAFPIGQNRLGQKILYAHGVVPGSGEIRWGIGVLDLASGNTKDAGTVTYGGTLWGWISQDDSVWVMDTNRARLNLAPKGTGLAPVTGAPVFLAVPTHDFSGAWTIERGPGKPTTLRRQTLSGSEVMWSDVAGPEVEALIAGESGQTLLVQVHRDRSAQLQRPFIDPALAVWRVGEGMPRSYDELYLNEESNKGFVHVDVDRMAGGEPFVFNSGSFQAFEEGPISPPIGGGGDVIQEWGVVRASLKQHLVLPGVARLRGAFDSNWLTDVTIMNPLDETQDVEIQYVALGQEALIVPNKTTIKLQPREIRFIPDTLNALFGVENGGGALHFLPAIGVNVTGRTYSRKGNGTFGYGMMAIDFYNAAGPRFPMTFAGAFPGDNFRTNILITDTSGRGTEAVLNAYGVSGPMGSSATTIWAPANGIMQHNGVAQPIGLLARDSGGLVVQPLRGTAIPTVVAIDNRTNDPTYFPPDLPATVARAIPVIGHVDGVNDARFRSDLYIFNPTAQTRTVVLEAKQWDSTTTRTTQFTLLPREARVVHDALPTLFQLTGLARLRYWSNDAGEGVRVTSRTYTIEPNGATYGSLIPPLNNFQIGTSGDTLEILGASGGPGFRTNIGLVELSPFRNFAPTQVRIRLFDNSGKQLETFTVSVPNAGGLQINDVFGARGITPPPASLITVQVLDAGLIGAYATLTDNVTNDTTYLGANLGAQPE